MIPLLLFGVAFVALLAWIIWATRESEKPGGRASWRWHDSGMRKGMMADLMNALQTRPLHVPAEKDKP